MKPFIDCKYESIYNVLKNFNKDAETLDYLYYFKLKKTEKDLLKVNVESKVNFFDFLKTFNIEEESYSKTFNLKRFLDENLKNGNCIVIKVDLFYQDFSNKYYMKKHKKHNVFIRQIIDDNVWIIENEFADSENYIEMCIKFKNLEMWYNGYLENYFFNGKDIEDTLFVYKENKNSYLKYSKYFKLLDKKKFLKNEKNNYNILIRYLTRKYLNDKEKQTFMNLLNYKIKEREKLNYIGFSYMKNIIDDEITLLRKIIRKIIKEEGFNEEKNLLINLEKNRLNSILENEKNTIPKIIVRKYDSYYIAKDMKYIMKINKNIRQLHIKHNNIIVDIDSSNQKEKYSNINEIEITTLFDFVSETYKIKGDEIEPTKESIEKILNIEEYFTEHINIQRNSINGYLKNKKGERYFFKLLKNDEAYKELQGYFLLLGKFNISEMYEILKYKNYSFIIFKYDSTIDTDKGLLNDFLVENDNIENLKEEHYKSIRIIINELLKGIKEKITLQDYPMKKFFNDRIDNRLKKWYKENLIIEFQKKKYYLDEIILKTERYFKTESYLECFLSQGDPNVLNIGTKPILFDYTTSGYNSIIAEFCTCTWSILFNDLYFAPKYHKASYYNHEKILTKSRQYNNLIKYEIYQNIVKITEAQIKTTKIRKIFMLEYIENLKKENVKIGKEFIFYMAMRILCIFNLNEMDQTDKIYSLYILIALIEKTEENSTNDMIEIIEKFILELEEF